MKSLFGNAACKIAVNLSPHPHPASTKLKVGYTGGRLNKKDGLTRYGDSHVKDKTS